MDSVWGFKQKINFKIILLFYSPVFIFLLNVSEISDTFFSVNPLSAPAQAAQSICHQLQFLTMSSFYCTPLSIPKPVL